MANVLAEVAAASTVARPPKLGFENEASSVSIIRLGSTASAAYGVHQIWPRIERVVNAIPSA